MKKRKSGKIAGKILNKLTDLILTEIYSWESYSEFVKRIYHLPGYDKTMPKRQLYDTVKRIKQQGWLEEKQIQDQIYYRLTQEGKVKRMVIDLRRYPRQRGHNATIIIFDIPEAKRTFRNFIRRLLKNMDFTMLQKSVFIAPNILPKEFYDLLKEMDLLQHVMVIEGRIRFQA